MDLSWGEAAGGICKKGLSKWSNSFKWHCRACQENRLKLEVANKDKEGRVKPIMLLCYLEEGWGCAKLLNNKNERLRHHSADNMTVEYALHVSHVAILGCTFLMGIHMLGRNGWTFLTWHEGLSGRRSWNINRRRGLYSSCHDNSNGWKWKCSPSPLWRLTDIHST